MTTEARLRRMASLGNWLIAWYSFSLIVFSLLDLSGRYDISSFSIISAAVSIAILVVSLIVTGEKFSERANEIKSCYLKLQNIYKSEADESDKMSRYSDVLSQYENQSDTDFDEMVFDAWSRGQRLRNAEGPVSVSVLSAVRVVSKRLARIVLVISAFALPIAFGVAWVEPVKLQQNEP